MLNILIPLAGKSKFFEKEDFHFPPALIEIHNAPMIEWVVRNLNQIREPKRFVFVVQAEDCKTYHLDHVLELLTKGQCRIVRLERETQGAACSCLMAIDEIDNGDPLILANGDQILDEDLNKVLAHFRKHNVDLGTVCFESVHPRWSFVRLDEEGQIVEASEKRPISKNAIAGFCYFRRGSDFVRSAMAAIEKGANYQGAYYTSATINEMVLQGKRIEAYKIRERQYHSFFSPQRIQEFQQRIATGPREVTERFLRAWNEKDLDEIRFLLDEEVDWTMSLVHQVRGKQAVLDLLEEIFRSVSQIHLQAESTFCEGDTAVVEFRLQIDSRTWTGIAILDWRNQKLGSLRIAVNVPEEAAAV